MKMKLKEIKNNFNTKTGTITETKLFSVLKEFTAYELNRLRKFVNSPYFNRNDDVVKLLDLLNDIVRGDGDILLTKETAWTLITNNGQYDDTKFRKLCSDLLKLTERYLMQEVYEQNSLQMADNLLVAVYNRKLKPLYKSALSTSRRLADQYYFRPSTYYYYSYALERGYYYLSGLELARSEQVNVEKIAHSLDKFYVAEKLRAYIMMTDSQRIATHDYYLPFVEEIVKYVGAGNLQDVVPINLYYQILLTRKEPERPEHFDLLKLLMQKHLNVLPQLEAFEILDSALNYCVDQVNQGKSQYLREYMELSLMGIKGEVLLVNGILSPWTFRNIVFAGLRMGDFEWVSNFIFGYQHKIDEQYRENAVSFNLANLYFYQKNYDKVITLLQEVEYEDPAYNRNSKIMLLLTYYELGEIEPLVALLSSFDLYLRRNKSIPDSRKKPYLDLIRYLRALVRISGKDPQGLKTLRKKVVETEGTVNKEWLLEKIDDLLA